MRTFLYDLPGRLGPDVPRYVIERLVETVPAPLLPSFLLGALHLFRPCCVLEYSLRRFGDLWNLPLPPWPETYYYDENRKCQQCLFCSRKISRIIGLGDDWWPTLDGATCTELLIELMIRRAGPERILEAIRPFTEAEGRH